MKALQFYWMLHRTGMSIQRLSTFFHWLFLLGLLMLPGKHDGRGWPSIWKKLLSGQRPGTGDCITPSYKEGRSCICLSQNRTVISSNGTREEAENHAAPISSLQPGLWYFVVFNIEHYFNAAERIGLNFTAQFVLCSVRRTEDYRTDRRTKTFDYSQAAPHGFISKSPKVPLFITYTVDFMPLSWNSSIKKIWDSNYNFLSWEKNVSSWKKEPRDCTLWNTTPCLILVMSSCCIYIFTHTYTTQIPTCLTLSHLPRILFSKSWPLKSNRKCPEV